MTICQGQHLSISLNVKLGGGGEIRTRDALSVIAVFKTAALDHYATPPRLITLNLTKLTCKINAS